jgi:hypothetical protein
LVVHVSRLKSGGAYIILAGTRLLSSDTIGRTPKSPSRNISYLVMASIARILSTFLRTTIPPQLDVLRVKEHSVGGPTAQIRAYCPWAVGWTYCQRSATLKILPNWREVTAPNIRPTRIAIASSDVLIVSQHPARLRKLDQARKRRVSRRAH